VAGCDGEDVGARDASFSTPPVHHVSDALDELQRLVVQARVLRVDVLLAAGVGLVQQQRRVAPLREAVVEEDAQEARGDLHVLVPRGLHGGPHHAMQVRARLQMEVRRQAPRDRVVHRRRRLQIRQRQRRRPCCGSVPQDDHGHQDMDDDVVA